MGESLVKHGVQPTAATATTAAVSWTSRRTASATATAAAIKQQSNSNSNDKQQLPHLRKQIRHNGSSFPLFPLARLDRPSGEVFQKGWPRASGG